MDYFDSDPILCLHPLFLPLPQNLQLVPLLHQKIRALNVLSLFWQSELLSSDLKSPNVLFTLEKHIQKLNDLSFSCLTVLRVRPYYAPTRPNLLTIESLFEEIYNKCHVFCTEIALPAKLKLRSNVY